MGGRSLHVGNEPLGVWGIGMLTPPQIVRQGSIMMDVPSFRVIG